MSVEVAFETHATSTDNERGIATGWLPGELSSTGRAQARELGARHAGRVDAVFTSELRRAVQTTRIAFGSGVPIHLDRRLRECNYGSMNGMRVEELERVRRGHIDHPFERGESYREVVSRVSEFLDAIGEAHEGGRVVLVGHSATLWALEHLVHAKTLEDLVGPFEWRPGWRYACPANG